MFLASPGRWGGQNGIDITCHGSGPGSFSKDYDGDIRRYQFESGDSPEWSFFTTLF
jgi:hypothetical protein